MRRWFKRLAYSLGLLAICSFFVAWYVRSHPLVFNESFWQHAHCIKGASGSFYDFAHSNAGKFPESPDGYGAALLQLNEEYYYALTGPGYTDQPMVAAKLRGQVLAEADCGRVYVQGLSKISSSELVLLYDKLATPGGDHCHFLARISAPLGREVLFVSGMTEFVLETDWVGFVFKQRQLLTQAGFDLQAINHVYPPVALE